MQYILNRQTWIKDLKGPPLSVLMAMLFYGGPDKGLGPSDLARYTGYKRPAVYDALQDLQDRGLCTNHGTNHNPAWIATPHAHQLMLPVEGPVDNSEKLVTSDYTFPYVVGVDLDPDYLLVQPTTTNSEKTVISDYTFPLPESGPDPAVLKRLTEVNVWGNRARQAAEDPWVTLRRVDGWIALLERDRRIKNLPAVLMKHLENHDEPPEDAPESSRSRFVEGKYAEFIEH